MKDDAHVLHFEPGGQLCPQRIDVVDIYVEKFTRLGADGMVVLIHVGVESHCPAVAVHELDLPHLGEFFKGLVHGSQRDAGHSLAGFLEQPFGSGMGLVVVHEGEQQLALRGQTATLFLVFRCNDVRRMHVEQSILSRCLFANNANYKVVVRGHTRAAISTRFGRATRQGYF